jgi:hypothetical protein
MIDMKKNAGGGGNPQKQQSIDTNTDGGIDKFFGVDPVRWLLWMG